MKYLRLKKTTILIAISFNTITAQIIIKSPDKSITANFNLNKQKELVWCASFNNQQVIETSNLGVFFNHFNINTDIKLSPAKKTKVYETYPSRGVHSLAVNHYNEAIIPVTAANKSKWKLQVRVFNDGIAFRYIINTKTGDTITEDLSSFNIPSGSKVWYQTNIKYYEGTYKSQIIDSIKKNIVAGPPVTIELPNNSGYLALTESNLVKFPGSGLKCNGNRLLSVSLAGIALPDETGCSPWRVAIIGKDLNTLFNSDIVNNVANPADKLFFPNGVNTNWIKPGRCVWSWLSDNRDISLENMKNFSKMAAELGFEYNLVDEGWSHWSGDPWSQIRELVDYSDKLGVKIIVWKAYPQRKGIEGIDKPEAREAFFKKCKETGVAGMKIDFFDSEKQEITNFYNNALADAARNKLMIDFHGSNKPTGQSRTYPNEMTREGIRGLENRPPWAKHNTILPFTRFLAGHADFTPLHFTSRTGEVSWAHHVATVVQFTSPLMVLGVDPKSLIKNPCRDFIKSIPTVWDETIVFPQSKIGESSIMARRNGNTWFLAAIISINEQQIDIPLSFLGKAEYNVTAIQDLAGKQDTVVISHSTANSASSMLIKLNANGGFAARFDLK